MKCGFNIDEIEKNDNIQALSSQQDSNESKISKTEKQGKKKKPIAIILTVLLLAIAIGGGILFFTHRELFPFGNKEPIENQWSFGSLLVEKDNDTFTLTSKDFDDASKIPAFSVSGGNQFTFKVSTDTYSGTWEKGNKIDDEDVIASYNLHVEKEEDGPTEFTIPALVTNSLKKDTVSLVVVFTASGASSSITYVFDVAK